MTEYPRTTTHECTSCDGEREFILDIRSLDVYECKRCGKSVDVETALTDSKAGSKLKRAVRKMRNTSDSDDDDDDDDDDDSTATPPPI